MGIVGQPADHSRFLFFNGKNIFIPVCISLDPLDNPAFPVRPVNELRLEKINTAGIGEYDCDGGGSIVVEKIVRGRRTEDRN